MSAVQNLKKFVNERLTAAAEEIFRVFEKTIVEYEEEINRQSRLLAFVWKPEVKLHRIELPQQHVCKEEEVLADQHLCIQERSSSLDQEDPEPPQINEEQEEQLVLKQETDVLMLTSTCEENEDQTLNWSVVEEKPSSYIPVITSVVSEANSDHQLLSHSSHETVSQDQKGGKHGDSGSGRNAQPQQQSPHHKSNSDINNVDVPTMSTTHHNTHTELPQQHVCKEEEVLADQHLCIQERSSSLDQEDPEPPQINEDQEEQLVLKQETDVLMLTSTCEENEDQTLNWSVVEEKPSSYSPVITSVVSEANSDHQLLSHSSHETVSQDQKGGKHGDSGSARNAQPQQQSPHHKSNSDIKNVDVTTMSTTHHNTHTGKKSLKCGTCERAFKCKSHLQKHLKTHSSKKPFYCKTCERTFKSSNILKGHMRTHTGEKPYLCNTCGKRFCDKSAFVRHTRIHTGEKPHTCKSCGKEFSRNDDLTIHMRMHTGEKPYLCKPCGKRFYVGTALTKHMRIHTGEKPYTCKTCGKRFCQATSLTRHMKTHTDERPYTCKTCGKAFRRSSHLNGHIRTHTGEKPYTCKTCGTRYCDATSLTRHMRIHTGEKLYTCKTCGKDFRFCSSLRKHVRTHS